MAEGKQLDYKSAKIALTVSKSALTKSEKEFEINCKDIQKNGEAIHIKKFCYGSTGRYQPESEEDGRSQRCSNRDNNWAE